MLRLLTCLILAVAAWLLSAPSTSAQDYPSRPVKLIIPLGPGGGGDVFTRLLAEELQKRLGQPFVVENRPGGGLNIGSRACAEAAPDGYTLLRPVRRAGGLQPVHVQEPAVQSGEGFRAGRRHVHQRQRAGHQRLAQRQDDPGAGRAGEGEARHAELRHVLVHAGLFHGQAEQGQRHRHRPRAVPQRQRDGQRGDGQHDADRVPRPGQHDRARSRAGSSTRWRSIPTCARRCSPTCRRCGEAMGEDYPPPWFGLFAPAGTPLPIIEKINAEVQRITSEPGFRQQQLSSIARSSRWPGPRDEFAKFIASNRAFAARVAKETGMQPQ